jgi:hypothetical protein
MLGQKEKRDKIRLTNAETYKKDCLVADTIRYYKGHKFEL